MNRTLLAMFAAPALFACAGGTGTDLDATLHQEYAALLDDQTDDAPAGDPVEDTSTDERLAQVCRELVIDADIVEERTTEDGRTVVRAEGVARTERGERGVRVLFGERQSGRRVFFARFDEEAERARVIAGLIDDEGRVRGRVVDGGRRVRGVADGERDGAHLRLRLRLACRALANEGERELHDEQNDEADRALSQRDALRRTLRAHDDLRELVRHARQRRTDDDARPTR